MDTKYRIFCTHKFTLTKPLCLSGPYYHGNQGVASTITPFWVVPPPEVRPRTLSETVGTHTCIYVSFNGVYHLRSYSSGLMTTVFQWLWRSPTYRTTFSPVMFLMRWYSLNLTSYCIQILLYKYFQSLYWWFSPQMMLVDYYRAAPDLVPFSQYWCPDTTMMDKIKVGWWAVNLIYFWWNGPFIMPVEGLNSVTTPLSSTGLSELPCSQGPGLLSDLRACLQSAEQHKMSGTGRELLSVSSLAISHGRAGRNELMGDNVNQPTTYMPFTHSCPYFINWRKVPFI